MARLMKNSGIQWIGDIPQNWKISTLGKVSNIITGNTPSKSDNNLYYSDNGLKWVKPDNLNGLLITQTKEYINEKGRPFAKIVPPYTPLMCCIGSIGKIGYCETETAFNQQINAILFNENLLWKYGYYYLISQEEQHWFYANGNVLKILNTENQKKIFVVIPPLDEQQRIANYLDEKCSKIDETIEKEKAIIEKLKEYKQSLITETVTKGVNPNVPLKDSGIDWIGSIPQHWDCVKLKKMLSYPLQYGANASGEIYDDKKPRYIRITDITMDNKLKEEGKLSLNFNDAEPYILQDGDILFARSGATVGKTFIYYKKYGFCAFAGYLIKATPNCKMIPKFLYYYTLSNSYEQWRNQIFIQATIQNIGADKYSNMQLTFPPMKEQEEIVKYLDEKCNAIENAITQRETLIDKLTQYKKSLIYECVTGKKEI